MDNWTREQTKTLINLFRQCPCLYNPRHPDYVNKTKRNFKYHIIMNRLKPIKDNVTISNIKKKIRTLQSQLSKEKVRFKSSGLDESCYMPSLWCYKDLLFLTKDSMEDPNSSSVDRPANERQPKGGDVNRTTAMNSRVMSAKLQKEASEALAMVKTLAQNLDSQGREQVFCTYLCSELKAITSDDLFEDLKMEILQLVHAAIKKQKTTVTGQKLSEDQPRISPCEMIELGASSDNSAIDNESYYSYGRRAESRNSSLSVPSPVPSLDISDPFPDPLDIDPGLVTSTTKRNSKLLVKREPKK